MRPNSAAKFAISIILSIWSLVGVLNAQQSAADLFGGDWGKIAYLQAEITVKGIEGFKPNENYQTQIQWKENLQGSFFRKVVSKRFGATEFNVSTAFDGQHYYELNQTFPDALLLVSKLPPTNRDIPNFPLGFFPLDPFSFLHNTVSNTKNTFPGIRDIQAAISSGKLEKAFAAGIEEADFEGTPARVITIPGFRYLMGDPVTYKIFFSKSLPPTLLGWKSFFADNSMSDMLVINQWKVIQVADKSGNIRYPSDFTERFYRKGNTPGTSVLSFGYSSAVDIKKLSTVATNEEFTLDPSEADYIYDTASKTVVAIPR